MLSHLTKKSVLMIVLLGTYMCLLYTAEGMLAAILVDVSKDFSTSVGMVGQLSTILGTSWGLTALMVGPVSDRLGRRWMLITGHILSGIALWGYSISPGILFLMIFSAFLGIGGAMGGPSTLAAVGDHFPDQIRGRVMSIVNIGAPVSALVGVPVLTVVAGILGWRWGFFLLGIFLIGTGLSGKAIMPKQKTILPKEKRGLISSVTAPLKKKWLVYLLFAVAMLNGANCMVSVYFIAFLIQGYSLTMAQVAPFLSLMALGQLLGVVVGGPLADRFNKLSVSAVMQGLSGLSAVAFMYYHGYLWVSICLGSLFFALSSIARPSYFSLFTSVSSDLRGTVMGIQAFGNRLGRAGGAAAGGLVLLLASSYMYLGVLCLMLNILAIIFFLRASYKLKRLENDQLPGFN